MRRALRLLAGVVILAGLFTPPAQSQERPRVAKSSIRCPRASPSRGISACDAKYTTTAMMTSGKRALRKNRLLMGLGG